MSENRKLLEDENISVEYDIVNGLVCIDKIYLKEAKEAESKPITSYEYVSEVTGTTLRYSDFNHDEFTLKISGKDVFILGVQRLAVFVSEDFVDKVEILEDNIIAQDKPFVIEEDRVGEYISYDLISLIYFSDGVLIDDWEVPVENPDETVGKEYVEYFETGKAP